MNRSFVWAGYECTYAKIDGGVRLDVLADTKHDKYCRQDYELIGEMGIRTVREGLSWSQIDQGGTYDWGRWEEMMAAGRDMGVEQVWDLNHFDYPDDIDPMSSEFVERFAEYARRAVQVIRKYNRETIYIVPINEISFFTFIAADAGRWAPYLKGRGEEFKKQLVRAALAAMISIRRTDSRVRFIQVDPVVRRIALHPEDREAVKIATDFREIRFEAWDMLAGKLNPELGGGPEFMDLIGVNYYYHNQQWVKRDEAGNIVYPAMGWNSPHRVPVGEMVEEVYRRYGRPVLMTETGMWGSLRYRWWKRLFREIEDVQNAGIPLGGLCVYPAVDRLEWGTDVLTNSGLWDFAGDDPECRRIPHGKSIEVVGQYIRKQELRLKEGEQRRDRQYLLRIGANHTTP